MLTPEENELLTKVTDGAPMERIMRSHWVPICLTEELPENDGTPFLSRCSVAGTWLSVTPMGWSGYLMSYVLTATHPCSMAETRTVD